MLRKMLACCAVPLLAACTASQHAPTAFPSSATAAPNAVRSMDGGAGLVRRELPGEDPGPPFYARVGKQVLESDGYVMVPFYRSPTLVPADFNLLAFYDFPGPAGPGAFAAPLLMTGFSLTEADAPLGTFPRQVELRGAGVPIWFVPSSAFRAAAQDGTLTIAELRALSTLVGTASRYHETLHPREDDHKIVIEAAGTLEDGRAFTLSLTHVGDSLRDMRIVFR